MAESRLEPTGSWPFVCAAKTEKMIATAYLLAIATFVYIAMVAMVKTPIFFDRRLIERIQ